MTLDSAEECGKLFVGGLSWDTSVDKLKEYFSRYGEVSECAVMKNPETGRSRGFGFISFRDPECAHIVLSSGPHLLDGRTIDPKSCNKGAQKGKREAKKMNHPKIFLGGLPSDVNETQLRDFFSKYGKVVEVVIMYNQERKSCHGNGFRGFGFLSFEHDESVSSVVAEHFVTIHGKKVEVKRAQPREKICPSLTAPTDLNNFLLAPRHEAQSVPSFWCPAVLSGSAASATTDPLVVPVSSSAILSPIGMTAAWPSAHPSLTSIPWIPAPHSVPAAILSTGPALFGTSSTSFPHLVPNSTFGTIRQLGAHSNPFEYGPSTRLTLPQLVPGGLLPVGSNLTVTTMPLVPSHAPRPMSAVSSLNNSCVSSLRFKPHVPAYHPYRRM